MTDRELLELAAKAAGIEIQLTDDRYLWIEYSGVGLRAWNPLADDGDALRLAVKLQMRVSVEELRAGVITAEWGQDFQYEVEERVPDESFDPYAATRLAIVRAAADIGKQKG